MTSESIPLVSRKRGDFVESEHFGSAILLTADGNIAFAVGNYLRPCLPRSAIKLIHALPFLASGAANRGDDGEREIVLAASSHIATPMHLAALARFASRISIVAEELVCGPDHPLARGVARTPPETPPTAFHNNNAGKHLGILATCQHLGDLTAGYASPDHPAMQRLARVTGELCDVEPPSHYLVENCGLPTCPLPLVALARGMARLARPDRLPADLAQAATRLLDAIGRAPDFLAGPRRLPTEIARVTGGRVIAKGGSEGVYAALDRRSGQGFALKIDDGSGEAATCAIVALLAASGSLDATETARLESFTRFWRHAFAPERSLVVEFPFLDGFRRS